MNTARTVPLFLALAVAGCGKPAEATKARVPSENEAAAKRVPAGKNVSLEVLPDGSRRVWIDAVICYREGPLEEFLCRKGSKEHESIVAADIDARDLHRALLLAEAKEGSTVKFQPEYKPATGSAVRVLLEYSDKGKTIRRNARDLIRNFQTKKELQTDWVFGGSEFYDDPDDPSKPKLYAANGGDVISVSNFASSTLDIPVNSSAANEELSFECWTERIPPIGTKVAVILEVIPSQPK